MHFNININLDKNKSGKPEVGVEEQENRGASASGSPGASASSQMQQQQQQHLGLQGQSHQPLPLPYHDQAVQPPMQMNQGFSVQPQYTGTPTQMTHSMQQQLQLRDLYTKFTLLQHKLGEANNALLEAKAATLKKDEEVLSRDQIIAVLTHTIRMKDKEIAARDSEVSRLRSEIQNMCSVASPQSVGNTPQDLAGILPVILQLAKGSSEKDDLRDKVIAEQFELLKGMAQNASNNPPSAIPPPSPLRMERTVSTPRRAESVSNIKRQSSVRSVPSPPQPGMPSVQEYDVFGSGVFPADRINTAIQIPNEEVSLGGLSGAQTPMGGGGGVGSSYPASIAMSVSRGGSFVSNQCPPHRGSTPTAPADKHNTAIVAPGDELDLDALVNSLSTLQPEGLSEQQKSIIAESLRSSRQGSRRNSAVPTPVMMPAAKRNTAIEVPGDEVDIDSQYSLGK